MATGGSESMFAAAEGWTEDGVLVEAGRSWWNQQGVGAQGRVQAVSRLKQPRGAYRRSACTVIGGEAGQQLHLERWEW